MQLSQISLAITRLGGLPFSPAGLFSGGTQGAWYDPSDASTLFSDTAGTTPSPTPGGGALSVVGAMLDKRAPNYSVFFDGAGDFLASPANTALALGTGDFTVECWVYATATPSDVGIYEGRSNGNAGTVDGFTLTAFSGSVIRIYSNAVLIASTGTVYVNTWCHVAVVRASGTWTLYINGVSQGTSTASRDLTNNDALVGAGRYGVTGAATAYFPGYISNFRIVKGTAVYTSNFTPPTAPLTAITNTSLLTCGNSWSGNPAITVNGDCKINQINPFATSPLGNHAISYNTTTARPELSARVNLLTYSEQFDNAYWTKRGINAFGSGSVANTTATLDPLGGNTADFIQESTAASVHGVDNNGITLPASTFIHSVYIKAATRNWAYVRLADAAGKGAYFNLSNGTIGTVEAGITAAISSVGNGWYRCSVSITTTAGLWYPFTGAASGDNQGSYTGDGTSGIYIWGADLRPSNIGTSVPAYQRVADQYTYDSNGFPRYLVFNGTASGMYTPANLNLSGTDKATVFAGVRKIGNGGGSFPVIAELSADWNSNTGTFLMFQFQDTGISYGSRGTGSTLFVTGSVSGAPLSSVATGQSNIAGPSVSVRLNGAAAASSTTSQGTGNYGTYALNIGARNAQSGTPTAGLLFNGYLYSLIVVGAASTAAQISSTESWINVKQGGVY